MGKGIEIGRNILGMRYMLGDEPYTVFEQTATDVCSIPLNGSLDSSRSDRHEDFLAMFDSGLARQIPSPPVLSRDMLSAKGKEKFQRDYSFIREIEKSFGSFSVLKGRTTKVELNRIIGEYGFSPSTAWRIINRYLKGGCTEQALFNPKYCISRGPAVSGAKRGAPAGKAQGVEPSEELQHHLEWALNEWKANKYRGFRSAYRMMLKVFYTFIDKDGFRTVMDEKDVPTMKQFIYYCNKHLSEAERKIAKTSRREFENNERILLSSLRAEAKRPFSLLQGDAFEAGIQLVSDADPTQCVGKATVYTFSDVYTGMIVAAVPGFEVNSNQGLCDGMVDLMLTDHIEMLRGLNFSDVDEDLWPSFIKPDRIFCDRGSDYTSEWFRVVCERLKIERSLEPPAFGSGKGIVERSYRDFSDFNRAIFADFGATNREYGDNGRRTACMTIDGFRKVLARFVLFHNEKVNVKYPMDEDMIRESVKPSPVNLYRYGKRFGTGARVPEPLRLSVFYDLMVEDIANITREGIVYKGLYYKPANDPYLMECIQRAKGKGDKRHPDGTRFNDLAIRYDLHSIGRLYYVNSKGEISSLVLNTVKSRFSSALNWSTYLELKQKKDEIIRNSAYQNDVNAIEAERYTASVIKKNRRTTYATEERIREARADERSRLSEERSFGNRPEFRALAAGAEQQDIADTGIGLATIETDDTDTPPWM